MSDTPWKSTKIRHISTDYPAFLIGRAGHGMFDLVCFLFFLIEPKFR